MGRTLWTISLDIPESQLKESKMHSEFFMEKGISDSQIFQSCLKEMKEFVISEIETISRLTIQILLK